MFPQSRLKCPNPFLLNPSCAKADVFTSSQSYKERLRQELSRKFEFDAQQKTAASQELTQAVPPTETLNSEPQKSRAELASVLK